MTHDRYILTIAEGKLVLDGPTGSAPIPSLDVLRTLTEGTDFYVSSTIDFASEYTSDPAVLALVDAVRRES